MLKNTTCFIEPVGHCASSDFISFILVDIIQSAYITYFYETIGAKLTYIAAYVAIARSFDVITDPLMGWMSDNTRSPFGRRKPYMAIGAVLYNTMMLSLLNPPRSMGHPGISHWFGTSSTSFWESKTHP